MVDDTALEAYAAPLPEPFVAMVRKLDGLIRAAGPELHAAIQRSV